MVVVVVRQVPAGVCMLCKTGLLVAIITGVNRDSHCGTYHTSDVVVVFTSLKF